MSETMMTDEQVVTDAGEQAAGRSQTDDRPAISEDQAATAKPTPDVKPAEVEQEKPQGAPEKYDFKAPDGQSFDPSVIEAYGEVAKSLNLSQEAAQKILETMAPVLKAQQSERLDAMWQEWAGQSSADKEFGGDRLKANLAIAKKALDTFGTPELRTLLNDSGLGNHPEIIRAFYRAGKSISEDTFVGGRAPTGAGKSLANALYPNQ